MTAVTTSVWDDVGDDAISSRIADDLRQMVRDADSRHDRSQQTDLGPSEIGDPCTYCLAAKILGVWEAPQFDDPWARIVGTAVHDWLDGAAAGDNIARNDARWVPELRVHPDTTLLPSGGRCDLFDNAIRTVIDHKIVGEPALRKYRTNGPGLGYRRQVQLYGRGYQLADWPVERVAIAFWPRSGRLNGLHVWSTPYDEAEALEVLVRYQTLRNLCETAGEAILPTLPQDSDCWTCSRRPPSPTRSVPA